MTRGLLQLSKASTPFKGGLVMNSSLSNVYTGSSPLLNWFQVAANGARHVIQVTGGDLSDGVTAFNLGYQNSATGELNSGTAISNVKAIADSFFVTPANFSTVFNGLNMGNGPGGLPWWSGMQWLVTWKGAVTSVVPASFATFGTGGTPGISNVTANSCMVTFGTDPFTSINAGLQLNFTPGTNNPPTNLKAYPNLAGKIAADATGTIWDPDWLADIKTVCGYYRFMDANSTNTCGASDISQLADANYFRLWHGVGGGAAFTGNIASGVLTVSGISAGSNIGVGSAIQGPGVNPNTVVTSRGTGTGGNGTYNVSGTTTAASASMSSYAGLSFVGANGPKGGVHPSVICDFCNRTGVQPWFCFPATASDQMAIDVATYFRDNLPVGMVPIFEYSNEIWNLTFNSFYAAVQTTGPGPGAGGQGATPWGGFRAAQIMTLISSVYNNRSRWWGSLGAQCNNSSVFDGAMQGVNYYLNNVAVPGTVVTDLFNSSHIAPYFGPDFNDGTVTISSVTPGNPTIINTASNHGYTSGQSKRLFISGGTTGLNNKDFTITVTAANQFTIPTDTTGETASGTMYSANSAWFQIFDQSTSLNVSNPVDYPTKYSYASQQMAQAIMTGTTANGFNIGSGNSLPGILSLMQQNQIKANQIGLKMIQYEGGPENIFSGFLGVNPQYTEFASNMFFESGGNGTFTMPLAYKMNFDNHRACFSPYPAIYSDIILGSTWATLRFFGDEGNAKWQACLAENANGVFVDPTPLATGTYSYKGGLTASPGSANPWTTSTIDIGAANPTRVVVVGVGFQGTSVNSITVNGSTLTKQTEGVNGSFRSSIWSGPVPTGSGLATIIINSTSPIKQNIFVYTATNLASQSPTAVSSPAQPVAGSPIAETKGSMIVTCGFGSSITPSYTGSSSAPVITDNSLQASGAAFTAMFNTDVSQTPPLFSFSSPLWSYRNSLGGSCVYALAVYR